MIATLKFSVKTSLFLILQVLLFGTLEFANAECGTEKLEAKSWRQEYDNIGTEPRERCTWTFDSPINEKSVLTLRIRSLSYSTYKRQGFLILPNGTRVDFTNKDQFVGKCMKFVRKGFKSAGCLKDLEDNFCFATITESEIWPPMLSSSTEFNYINRNSKYVYPFRFNYDYRYLECPNGTYIAKNGRTTTSSLDTFYVSTIVLSVFVVIFFLIAVSTSFLLWKKTRKPSVQNADIVLTNENNKKRESVYENHTNLEAELISNRNNAYSNMEENSCKCDDDNCTYAIIPAASRSRQVVHNILYHTYEKTNERPKQKQDQS